MPHCIIEHSVQINSELLVPLVFSGALESELFEADGSDIKVRAQAFTDYQTGLTSADFVHVTLKILSGRTLDQKQALSQGVLSALASLGLTQCAITVEVLDIDRASYSKLVS